MTLHDGDQLHLAYRQMIYDGKPEAQRHRRLVRGLAKRGTGTGGDGARDLRQRTTWERLRT